MDGKKNARSIYEKPSMVVQEYGVEVLLESGSLQDNWNDYNDSNQLY